ncbi:TDP-N-acetylfucosamine:lipid II N-acetylfucosaminyltransferase [Psychroflexus sediminis]|uniref:4-alpha-L-fucosyltransferase glycosyl transferase group 56 n=1 Tax=Psychroflexus sediminis TaxID=470826 RepID=A0A1G7UIS8_9FLAO|nr:TDP-N-acetylfucosamine:lipid II N-acetylfucosaminyltransferase [Psychroflexus sediminis]SDG47414.1 4-alpha-L-fucosyltransferase glycosyl transferase group 56 [Psychroflexus sediminis]
MSFTKKNKFIHIAKDEKFINSAYWQFEQVVPGQNVFYILVDDLSPDKLKYLSLRENMILIKNDLVSMREFLESIKTFTHFIFHGLGYESSIIFNRLPEGSIRYWMLFGIEFYQNQYLYDNNNLFGGETNLLYKRSLSKFRSLKTLFKAKYYRINKKTKIPELEIKEAIENADFLGIFYKEEFNFIKSRIKNEKLEHLKFSYYPIEKMLNDAEAFVSGNNILLGNSASYTNNHLEVLNLLSNLNISDKKVICPLSYGDEYYAKTIIKEGRNKLKNSFEALNDFIPLHKYNSYLEQCGFVIMNHYRQQAVGNVMTMLWMGAKVFLDDRNTLYHYLKRINVNVFNIKHDLNQKELSHLLNREQRLHNRKILLDEIGQEILQKEFKIFLAQHFRDES